MDDDGSKDKQEFWMDLSGDEGSGKADGSEQSRRSSCEFESEAWRMGTMSSDSEEG